MPVGDAVHSGKGVPVSNLIDTSVWACLSLREKELLSHVLEGHSTKAIAQHFGIIEATAKTQLASLLRKISVENRTQATIWALANLPQIDTISAALSGRQACALRKRAA
jgi:DNA-binding CsgD family transcriptional regulator